MIPLQPLILMLSYIAAYKWKWQNGCICSHFELYNITKLKKLYWLRLSCNITQPFSTQEQHTCTTLYGFKFSVKN